MNIFNRIWLAIYSFITGIISIAMIGVGTNLIAPRTLEEILAAVYTDLRFAASWTVVFFLLLLLSLKFLFQSDRRGKKESSVDQRTDFGDVRISMETIESLSLKATYKFRGVKDVKSKVKVEEAGLVIALKMSVEGNQSIPELSEEIQRSVHDYVEEITGLPVASVTVFVSSVVSSGNSRQRVE
jgi:uncharacterized alkaline shock family protein YloU